MTSFFRTMIALLLVATTGALVQGQTVLFDFEPPAVDNFGNFGVITTSGSILADCGTVGNSCMEHTGNFTENPLFGTPLQQPDKWGLLDIGPFSSPAPSVTIDLSGFIGYTMRARFIRDTDGLGGAGNELFTGTSDVELGLHYDPNDTCNIATNPCSDAFAPGIPLTETFQTITVLWTDLILNSGVVLGDLDFSTAQIKTRILSGVYDPFPLVKTLDTSSGIGRFEFDDITGILPAVVNDADFNNDTVVDGADFLIWQRGVGSGTTNADGDANGDGVVNAADLTIWQADYGTTGAAVAASVPEPTTIGLAVLSLCGLMARRRRNG